MSDDIPLAAERVADLEEALAAAREDTSGEPSDYLEDVPGRDPGAAAVAVCDTEGRVDEAGDSGAAFVLQPVAKAFVYAVATACLTTRSCRYQSDTMARWR